MRKDEFGDNMIIQSITHDGGLHNEEVNLGNHRGSDCWWHWFCRYQGVPQCVPFGHGVRGCTSHGKKVTDSQGRQEYSYDYTFKWVTTDGQTRTVGFEQSSANPTPLAPGSYVKADVSKTRVTKGPFSVNAKDVPAKVLQQLK